MQQPQPPPQPRAGRWGCIARRGWGRAGGRWTTWRAEGGRGRSDGCSRDWQTDRSEHANRHCRQAQTPTQQSAAAAAAGSQSAPLPDCSSRGSDSGSTKSALSFIPFVRVTAVCLIHPRCGSNEAAANGAGGIAAQRTQRSAIRDPRQGSGRSAAQYSVAFARRFHPANRVRGRSSGSDRVSERKKKAERIGPPPRRLKTPRQPIAANVPSRFRSGAKDSLSDIRCE